MQSQKLQNDLGSFPTQNIHHHSIQVYAPTTTAKEAEAKWFYEDLQNLLELTSKKVIFIRGDGKVKGGSQEIAGVTGKFGLGVPNELYKGKG